MFDITQSQFFDLDCPKCTSCPTIPPYMAWKRILLNNIHIETELLLKEQTDDYVDSIAIDSTRSQSFMRTYHHMSHFSRCIRFLNSKTSRLKEQGFESFILCSHA